MILARLVDLFAFKLPYCGLCEITKVSGRRRRDIWNKLPFRNLRIARILSNGNIIISSWEGQGIEWDIYYRAIYDQFF